MVDLDLQINEDILEKYIEVKELKPYAPTVSTSGDNLTAFGMARLAFPLILR